MAGQPELSFAGLLRQLRAEARLTQEELAAAATVSPRSVSDLERGINRTPHKDTAVLLASALGLSGSAGDLFVAAARGKIPAADVLAAARHAAPAQLGGVTGSPYRGLKAFQERDAAFFFGRETATAQVLGRMSRLVAGTGLLVVSGVSGAGKSSLLRAGVLPRIRAAGLAAAPGSRAWPCLLLTPTQAPLDELALRMGVLARADAAAVRRELEDAPAWFALTARQAALARPRAAGDSDGLVAEQGPQPGERRVVLVVDQFEELFTQCPDEGQRRAFITALHGAAVAGHGPDRTPAALVVLGVRADFEARCADYPQLADPVQDRYLVTAMTERQLRMAITEPAKKAGAKVDDDLTDLLLAEVRNGQPGTFGAGVLPLLSHALDQAWRSRTGETLTLADYDRAGGIDGAVAASAQRAYDRLTPAQQAAARQVFLRLTATSPDGIDTASRATRAELTEGKSVTEAQDVEAVLEAFAAERLLTLAAGTVELSHEVLLTAWPLLRDTWLADTRADRIIRTRLHATAAEWARHSRDPSYLYGGSLLAAATDTAARSGADPARHPPFSHTETDFLHASDRAHRRTVLRRRSLIALLTALVLGFAAATVVAIRASQQVARQRDIAISGLLISQSQRLGDANPALSRLLSVVAWRLDPSSAARYAMLAAAVRPGIAALTASGGAVDSVAFSPDGKTIATGNADGTVRVWDVATHRQITTLTGPTGGVNSVAFSPDGKTLASGNGDGTVRLWDAATHRQIAALTGPTGTVTSVAFSPDGKTLASGSADGTVRLWDAATHRQITFLTGPTGTVTSVAFSPDGKTLAAGNADGTVRLWDIAAGRPVSATLTGPADAVNSVAFSPDGTTLAVGHADGTVRLWGVASHRQITAFAGAAGAVNSVAFSPDGKIVATGSDDGTIRLWDVATHQQITALAGPAGAVTSVAFSKDGQTLASGNADGTVRLWDMAAGRPVSAPLTGPAGTVTSVAFSPDNTTLAAGNADGTVRLWDMAAGRPVSASLTGPAGAVTSVAFSKDGQTLATGNADGTVRLWDMAAHRQITVLTGPAGAVTSVAFSSDGILAAGDADGTVRLWDMATRRPISGPPTSDDGPVFGVTFSADGGALAVGYDDGTVGLWELAPGSCTGGPPIHDLSPATSVAFSPDGQTLAIGHADGTIRLWDAGAGVPVSGYLTGAAGPVTSVAFSPDGTTLASASPDHTVRVWDLATSRPIGAPLTGHAGPVTSVAFSPDGKTLATGSADHTVRLWDVAYLVNVASYLCASAGRSLTHAEWARYVPGLTYRTVCA